MKYYTWITDNWFWLVLRASIEEIRPDYFYPEIFDWRHVANDN